VSKQADQLVASDELVRMLLNSTGEGIYGIDLNGDCTFANPACARMLGYESRHELIGRNMHDLVHHSRPDGTSYPESECRIYKALRQDEGTHVDDELLFRPDGSSFPVEYWSFPLFRDEQRVGCVVTFVDISERLRVAGELRATGELVQLLLDSTGEGIYGIDLNGDCTFANPACVRLLGYEDREQLLGKNMHDLVHHTRPNGEPYPETECRIYQALRQEEGTHVLDELLFRPDGSSMAVEYWSYPMFREGKRVGCVVTFVDISERLRVEEELRQTEKMAALGKLSAGLAHELNNPAAAAARAADQLADAIERLQVSPVALAKVGIEFEHWAILGESLASLAQGNGTSDLSPLEVSDREEEMLTWLEGHGIENGWEPAAALVAAGARPDDLELLAGKLPAAALPPALAWLQEALTAKDLVGIVVGSSSSISELVGVVKSYSHMDRAPVQDVDVHRGIEDAITLLGHKLRQGLSVVREYDRELPRIGTRGSELNQVWTNLLDNAIGALGTEGTITIRTFGNGEELTVEIEDDGPGIPDAIRSRIFEPFFTTKQVGDGTGLGLDVVRRIVTGRCGGQIDVRSKPGQTVFRVSVPIELADECPPGKAATGGSQ
jgi:PAS domain S-box-containing protein